MNQDELLKLPNGFERNDFECKRAQHSVSEDACKTVSIFANTSRGLLAFGVSEHGQQLGDAHFRVQEDLRHGFEKTTEQVGIKSGLSRDQVGTKSGLSTEQLSMVSRMSGTHDIATLMEWTGRTNRSKQRYILTPQGKTLQAGATA